MMRLHGNVKTAKWIVQAKYNSFKIKEKGQQGERKLRMESYKELMKVAYLNELRNEHNRLMLMSRRNPVNPTELENPAKKILSFSVNELATEPDLVKRIIMKMSRDYPF